jgi:hypothetical protein
VCIHERGRGHDGVVSVVSVVSVIESGDVEDPNTLQTTDGRTAKVLRSIQKRISTAKGSMRECV